ncbi:hypothetical protein [Janthinobacterium lividum]|uniref:hypothetical protein n=1 Tax=Janthinobacterium lividum TaxID=29581 RepID=UPI001595BB45|nr:hypothetical protein [Janthinobacterium lividum]QKY11974.1 hypothetical protein G8765_29220 [Janthinobacterium lividum]
MKKLLCAALFFFASLQASAWDGVSSGKIAKIEAVGGAAGAGNFDLRVYLSSTTPPCPSEIASPPAWSYMNSVDANYKGILSVLLMAQALNKTVTIHSNRVAGYCQIAWVIITEG